MTLPSSTDGQLHATFTVRFDAASAPGAVQITATGCTQAAGACAPTNGAADAQTRLRAVYALFPALVTLPSAAVTALGDVRSTAALTLRNTAAWSGGAAVQAGGDIDLANAVLVGPGGASRAALSLARDTGLSSTNGEAVFRQLMAVDRRTWRRLTGVQSVVCGGTCNDALSTAVARVPGAASLSIDGDLTLTGPLSLGTASRPVLLVVRGRLIVTGAVRIAGLVEAQDIVWNRGSSVGDDGGVEGAVVSESGYGGTGAPTLAYNLGVLGQLRATGQAVRVGGGWRDF